LNNPDDEETISNNFINYMINDMNDKNILWIGTADGLSKLDINTGKFKRYLKNGKPQSIGHNTIKTLADDGNGKLWIGTYGGGLYKLDKQSEEFEGFRVTKNSIQPGPEDFILSMTEDKVGKLVIGTDKAGLWIFDRSRQELSPLLVGEKANLTQKSSINCLMKDDSGRIWIRTNDKGVFIYEQNNGTLSHIESDGSDSEGLASNWIKSFYTDRSGSIWVGYKDTKDG
jgi:ligand-binding sensor domain-containing protein